MKGLRPLLPATLSELVALTGRTTHQVNASLDSLRRGGHIKRSDKKVPNGNTGVGAHLSRLWVRT